MSRGLQDFSFYWNLICDDGEACMVQTWATIDPDILSVTLHGVMNGDQYLTLSDEERGQLERAAIEEWRKPL